MIERWYPWSLIILKQRISRILQILNYNWWKIYNYMKMQIIPKWNILRKIIEEGFKWNSECGKSVWSLEKVGNFWKGLEESFLRLGRQVAEPLKEAKMCSPSLKGLDMRQRPDGARLATEIDVPALDRSRELIVAQGQRAGAKARKETFNQSWDDCKSLGSLLLSLAIKEANHLRLDSVAFCIFSFPLFLDSLAFILESFSLPNFLRSAGYYFMHLHWTLIYPMLLFITKLITPDCSFLAMCLFQLWAPREQRSSLPHLHAFYKPFYIYREIEKVIKSSCMSCSTYLFKLSCFIYYLSDFFMFSMTS